MEENVSEGVMEADLVDETEADQIFLGKAGADQAVEIVAQSLCIKQFVINVGSLARYLSVQLMASQCIAMFVLEIRKKLKIIEGAIDSRRKILIVTKLPSKLILGAISVKEIMMS
jgi:hypothetical protein